MATVTKKLENLKKVILANVFFLITKLGMKIGEVEEKIGVSTGYLSRLNKEENNTKISVELIASLSEVLGYPMDLLCTVDLSDLTPNESTAVLFISKLIEETVNGKRRWDRFAYKDIKEIHGYNTGDTSHPLFRCHDNLVPFYNSMFAQEEGTELAGDIYSTSIGNGNEVKIAIVHYPNVTGNDYEAYIVSYDILDDFGHFETNTHAVCATNMAEETALDGVMKKLYSTVIEMNRHVQLSDFVKTAIEEYLTPPAPPAETTPTAGFTSVETDDLPF